jgi:hypothetical protein
MSGDAVRMAAKRRNGAKLNMFTNGKQAVKMMKLSARLRAFAESISDDRSNGATPKACRENETTAVCLFGNIATVDCSGNKAWA